MWKSGVWLLLTVLCLGCYDAQRAQLAAQAQRAATAKSLKELGLAMHASHVKMAPIVVATHLVASDTEYFKNTPREDQPADGSFAAGTKVCVVTEGEKYVVVKSTDGIEGYVTFDSIQLLTENRTDVKK